VSKEDRRRWAATVAQPVHTGCNATEPTRRLHLGVAHAGNAHRVGRLRVLHGRSDERANVSEREPLEAAVLSSPGEPIKAALRNAHIVIFALRLGIGRWEPLYGISNGYRVELPPDFDWSFEALGTLEAAVMRVGLGGIGRADIRVRLDDAHSVYALSGRLAAILGRWDAQGLRVYRVPRRPTDGGIRPDGS
jgi:hypothetical protein